MTIEDRKADLPAVTGSSGSTPLDDSPLPYQASISQQDLPLRRAATGGPAFSPGARLASRFNVIRYIAKGGMGEVYEALDEITGKRMALKTILPAIARDSEMVQQLRLEINNARQVTHENVCRVFEVFPDTTQSPPTYFLTMELLEGKTLSEVLRERGPIPWKEVLPLARQMAAGLSAVHRAGIVHQDFKTSNVLLTGSGDESRVVITDFGLAVNLRAKGEDSSMGGGTPAYMAPEQVHSGTRVDKRADIYAFGVVLYELLTGHFPIQAQTPAEMRQRKLVDHPLPLRGDVPDLPKHWERTILRCLQIAPENRYASMQEVMDALEAKAERRQRLVIAVSSATLLLIAVAAVSGGQIRKYLMTHRTPTIAVLGLKSQPGDTFDPSIGTELGEELSANLSQSKDLHVVPQDDVALVVGEFPVTAAANPEKEDLSGFQRAVGADYLILARVGAESSTDGGASKAANALSLDVKVQDQKGETVGAPIHTEGEGNYRDAVAQAAAEIRKRLGTQTLSEVDIEQAANIYPQDSQARKLYFEALEKLRALNAVEALDRLVKATQLEPGNSAIHAARSDALRLMNRSAEARLEAQKALQLAHGGHVPPAYLFLLEARAAELDNRWGTAVTKLDALYSLTRDNLGYGLLLSGAQLEAMQASDALKTLDELEKLPQPAGSDPRILIRRAEAFSLQGKYSEEIKASNAALHAARDRRWKLMEARANLQLCWAQQHGQASNTVMEACDQAQKIFSMMGDSVNGAVVLNNVANWSLKQARYEEAKQAYKNVVAITTAAGDPINAAGAHLNLANALFQSKDYDGAQLELNQTLALTSKTGDKYDEVRAGILQGEIYRIRDRLKDASDEAMKAQQMANAIGDRDTEAKAWGNLALYQNSLGDDDAAWTAANNAIAISKDLQDPSSTAFPLQIIAGILMERGDLQTARQDYLDAIKMQDPAQKAALADLWMYLADTERTAGNFAAAIDYAGRAANEYHTERDVTSEANALSVMVRAALGAGRLEDSATWLKSIDTLTMTDANAIADAKTVSAEYLMAVGEGAEALALLQSEEAPEGNSYPTLAWKLTLARAEWAAKQKSLAASQAAAVRNAATNAGFKRLAIAAREVGQSGKSRDY